MTGNRIESRSRYPSERLANLADLIHWDQLDTDQPFRGVTKAIDSQAAPVHEIQNRLHIRRFDESR